MKDHITDGSGLFTRMQINVCIFHGWIVGWAAMTFGSALALSMFNRNPSGFLQAAYDGFQIADAVPPMGKLSLGAIFATLLLFSRSSKYRRIGPIFAGAIAFALALVLPTSYYPVESKVGLLWLLHPTCGAIGGVVAAFVVSRCELKRDASNVKQIPR